MNIVTFNVNGLRSMKEHWELGSNRGRCSFAGWLDSFGADIICLQETKINQSIQVDADLASPEGYIGYFAFHDPRRPRKSGGGYSGVVTYVRKDGPWLPIAYQQGLFPNPDQANCIIPSNIFSKPCPEDSIIDDEARTMITDHGSFVLLNVYFPNDAGPERASYRQSFYTAISLALNHLTLQKRAIILVGDVNTTYHPIDHCEFSKFLPHDFSAQAISYLSQISSSPTSWNATQPSDADLEAASKPMVNVSPETSSKASFGILPQLFFDKAKPCRRWLFHLLHMEQPVRFVDAFRALNQSIPDQYTCWNTKMSARGANYGTRIDYILISIDLVEKLESCSILPNIMGSDHCPVIASLAIQPLVTTEQIPRPLPKLAQAHAKQRKLDCFFKKETINPKRPLTNDNSDALPMPSSPQLDLRPEAESTSDSPPCKKETNLDTTKEYSESSSLRLLAPPKQIPLCHGHGEPCVLQRTKKKGPNQGREFYSCARPVGHATNPDARCSHFEWRRQSFK